MRKVPVIYVVFVIDYFIRDQFTFLAKVNIRVKVFSVCSLHLMGNKYVCETCYLTQTFSMNTSEPLLTEFDSITNIQ